MKIIAMFLFTLVSVLGAPAFGVPTPRASSAVVLDDLPPGCRYVLGKLICDDEPLGDPR